MVTDLYLYPEKYSADSNGFIFNKITGRRIKAFKNPRGYLVNTISIKGKRKSFSLHKAILYSFIPEPFEDAQVNHKDGNKENNSLNNLEWVTASENMKHAIDELGFKPNSAASCKKIVVFPENKVFNSVTECAEYFNTNINCISRVLRGRRKTYKGNTIKYLEG